LKGEPFTEYKRIVESCEKICEKQGFEHPSSLLKLTVTNTSQFFDGEDTKIYPSIKNFLSKSFSYEIKWMYVKADGTTSIRCDLLKMKLLKR
jgi:hypothetical protein